MAIVIKDRKCSTSYIQRKLAIGYNKAARLVEQMEENGLVSPAGEDVSIGVSWRSSMMANSARDPYWQAAVRREVLHHPARLVHLLGGGGQLEHLGQLLRT